MRIKNYLNESSVDMREDARMTLDVIDANITAFANKVSGKFGDETSGDKSDVIKKYSRELIRLIRLKYR